jgi:hypothetical protein
VLGKEAVRVRWRLAAGAVLTLITNLSPEPLMTPPTPTSPLWGGRNPGAQGASGFREGADDHSHGRLLWQEPAASPDGLAPWSVTYTLSEEA